VRGKLFVAEGYCAPGRFLEGEEDGDERSRRNWPKNILGPREQRSRLRIAAEIDDGSDEGEIL
jgi:hypothetical protein